MKAPTQVEMKEEMECLDDLIKNANRVYDQSETRIKKDLSYQDSFLPILLLPFFILAIASFLNHVLGTTI